MKINKTMHANLLMSLLISVTTLGAHAQTTQDLINDGKTANDVLVYGMGYNAQRFSPLSQINKSNVKKLVPIWSYSMNDNRGAESFPIIHDGDATFKINRQILKIFVKSNNFIVGL